MRRLLSPCSTKKQEWQSDDVPTVESPEPTPFVNRLLLTFAVVQIVISCGLVSLGVHAIFRCALLKDPSLFAGMSPIFGGFLLVTGIIISCMSFKARRVFSFLIAGANLIIAVAIGVNESTTFLCGDNPNPAKMEKSRSCRTYLYAFNVCLSLLDRKLPGYSLKRVDQSVADLYNVSEVFLLLSIIAIVTAVAIIIVLYVASQTGKPVYLGVRRHKISIVVGEKANMRLAYLNKDRNTTVLAAPTLRETKRYETARKREFELMAQMQMAISKKASSRQSQDKSSVSESSIGERKSSKISGAANDSTTKLACEHLLFSAKSFNVTANLSTKSTKSSSPKSYSSKSVDEKSIEVSNKVQSSKR